MIIWTIFGVVALSVAFAASMFYNVDRMLRVLKVGGETHSFEDSGDVAVFDVKGVIFDSESSLRDIEEISERSDIKAVVVRVSSPGGAVGPTQEIYDALLRLKEKKKLICSFGDVAASGGYYLALACDKIFANAGTLTGSIGVVMEFVNMQDLFKWAKVDPFVIKAGKFKDIGSMNRAMSEAERALLQEVIDDVHIQFKSAVAKGRNMKRETVDAYADGRIFSGAQAKRLGFVDELGGEFEAIRYAAKEAGIKGEPQVVRRANSKNRLSSFLDSKSLAPVLDALMKAVFGSNPMTGRNPTAQIESGVPYFLPSHYLANGILKK